MKPENVFLVGDLAHPTVKVLDFGISKVGDAGGTALTRTGMIMGTPSYMAPEQARGEKVDQRADVYAVGGILYRALTGRKPFDSDDPSVTLTAVLTEDPPRPRSLEPSIPESLELIIQKAMAKEPAHRYPTMAALEAELAPFDVEAGASALAHAGAAGQGAKRGDADPGARTVLAGGVPARAPSQANLSRAAREARLARPLIVVLTVLGYGWILGGLVDAVSGILLTVRGGSPNITKTEALLITSAAFATTLTPLVLWVRRLGRGWGNSVRAVELAEGMRRVAAFAIGASGIGALVIRLMEVVLRAQALDVAWPFWSPVLFGASLLGAWVAYFSLRMERR
jgi:serine/threonine-protein kinase